MVRKLVLDSANKRLIIALKPTSPKVDLHKIEVYRFGYSLYLQIFNN
jgi:hypothetical protein